MTFQVIVSVLNGDVVGACVIRRRGNGTRERGVFDEGADEDVLALPHVGPDAHGKVRVAPQKGFVRHRLRL